ncbi:phage major capsid protein [Sediminispirochaeta smaragdinae]|uniref:Phage major capsid protein, HK97 family n=1 Tax=Sediminispirochaeta smaragdinae (strain DSM 11293 / JCM 15392 / SEBR 4228) TaxID=573413 RepID=E1R1H0_SEDSS|nr:phage major capsid protein [Sediminispirochaeta smaragdinae]ADK81111.1 phage major capsid protein, HK97 family [Sediminispirochaeta smaragdinae DSM 11293]
MDPEIRAAIEEQKKAWKAFQDANDQRLLKIEAGDVKGLSDINVKIDRITAAMEENAKVIERVGEIENSINKLSLGTGGGKAKGTGAFSAYMRSGDESGFRADATVQVDPDGGWLVPENIRKEIGRIAQGITAMRNLASVQGISEGASYTEFVTTSGAGAEWVAETEKREETATPSLARIDTVVHEMSANPKASQRLLDDAMVDIEAWLSGEVAIAFAELEAESFITGSGVKQPRGILSYDAVEDKNYTWGKLGYRTTGAAAGFASSNPEDALVDLAYALKSKYRNGATWLMSRTTLAAVRKFKTSMGYLWQPSFQAGEPSMLLGYPVAEDDAMPSHTTSGAFPIAFGDFKAGYRIVDHMGIRVLRDPYSAKPFISFYTTKQVGGGVKNFEAIKLLKVAA